MNEIDSKIKNIKTIIKNNPLIIDFRLELLQYECLKGLWEVALNNINYCLKIGSNNSHYNRLFKNNILCEIQRKSFFNHELDNHFIGNEINNYDELKHEIFYDYSISNEIKGTEKLESQNDVIHEFNVTLNNGEVMAGTFRDSDERTTSILEIFIDDKYSWISIHNIKSIEFYESQFLVDLIWRRAIITIQNGKQLPCFVPVRYFSNTLDIDEEDLVLAKKTQWVSDQNSLCYGIGQKTFELSNGIDFGILDIKKID